MGSNSDGASSRRACRLVRQCAPFIVIDGKAYRWKDVLDLRRAQLAAAEAAQGSQLALFPTLHDDRRSPAARTAAGRYLEPGLFAN